MKIECPNCRAVTENWSGSCPGCGFRPVSIEGFPAWAPEFSDPGSNSFYDVGTFRKIAALEEASFWFQSRNRLILWAMTCYCVERSSFAEIGCGTGFVLRAMRRAFRETEILGSDLYVEGLKFASRRSPGIELVQMDARRIPYRDHFDVIGIFDVLEHIEEDSLVLEQVRESLVKDGRVIITVPQHQWLWGPMDDIGRHVRRYKAGEIRAKVESAGFDIIRTTSFMSLLLPAMLLSRIFRRSREIEALEELEINRFVNSLLGRVMALEAFLIRNGVDFPIGGSRLLVARINPR